MTREIRKAWIGWWVDGYWCPTEAVRDHFLSKRIDNHEPTWQVPCPYCDFTLPAGLSVPERGQAEVAHMNEAHPDVIERRMITAGMSLRR